jgi:SulP family sulfate permease
MIAVVEAARAGLFARRHWAANLSAGVVVGIVSLPLSMAFAIASGMRPVDGLVSGVVAGLVVAIFGGTRTQIAGPTGAFVAILAGIAASHGRDGLLIAGLMAGALLLVFGLLRLGRLIRHVPDAVITGFTAGIGVVIFLGQVPGFLGIAGPPAGAVHERIAALLAALPAADPATTSLSLLGLALMLHGPRLPGLARVPGPLLAMLAATGLHAAVPAFAHVQTIGDVFGAISARWPPPSLPTGFGERWQALLPAALSIALLGALESLLSARIASARHDGDQELLAQGVANLLAPLFGGLATSGAIGRTAASLRLGATSPLAGIVHALTLLAILLALAPFAAQVPICALAAILVGVSGHLIGWPALVATGRNGTPAERLTLLVTAALTLYANLVVAVACGVAVALLGRRLWSTRGGRS